MKRRQFLKLTGQAAVCLAVGVPAIVAAVPKKDGIKAVRMADLKHYQSPDTDYVGFVHPDTYGKLMTGEIGHYEGIRFIEQTHLSL